MDEDGDSFMALYDLRLKWIRDRVYAAYSIADPACFMELLNRNDGQPERLMLQFLNECSEEEGYSALLFFKRLVLEEVAVQVEIEELTEDQNEDIKTSPVAASVNESVKVTEEKGEKKSKARSKSKSALSLSEHQSPKTGQVSAAEMLQEVPTEEEVKRVPLTKTIIQKIYRTVLYISCGDVPEEFMDSNVLFFLRNTKETINEPNDMIEAGDAMPKVLEYGMLNGHTLLMLKNVFSQVFMPLLSFNQHKSEDVSRLKKLQQRLESKEDLDSDSSKVKEQSLELPGTQFMRDELLMNMQKFLDHIQTTIQQIEGEIKLEMPFEILDADIMLLAKDPVMVEKLGQCVMNWQIQISTAIEEQLSRKAQGFGPLAEIDFWRERNATMSALSEQLKLPRVKKVLDIVGNDDPVVIQNLDLVMAELTKYHVEAADNVRFLSTLERHLKNLTHGTGFNVVLDTIPSMMNALRMVWIISRHYNKDERMVPLMERIAWDIAERVCRVLNIRTLFKENREFAKAKTLEAKHTLELWKSSYYEVREQIEASGRDQRWEFDRKRLFNKTDYLASICQDLFDILQV